MLTRGPIWRSYSHAFLEEDYNYMIERVHPLLIVIIIVLVHVLLRYFLINLSAVAFLDQFSQTRKEIEQKKRRKEIESRKREEAEEEKKE
jgi:cytochrome b subunit of formate dehydrogenase